MTAEATTEARQLPYILAITEGVRQSLQEYDTSFLAGEDVGLAGSVFRIYKGLYAEFGPERVIDSPISEAGLIGLGVGAGATGLRPMIDIMFSDFIVMPHPWAKGHDSCNSTRCKRRNHCGKS